jgi:hypothetical protein
LRRPAPPSLEGLTAGAFGLFGLVFGSRPIADNSAFTHIRTGIDMVAGHGIPRTDPYSFTARGAEWVVQSWFMSFVYGAAHRVADFEGVVVVNAVLSGALAFVVLRLVRTGSAIQTAAAGAAAIFAGIIYWSPRPLLMGLLCMALFLLVVTKQHSAWWLLPVMWVWGNSHGTYPLAFVWLGLHAGGAVIDRRSIDAAVPFVRYAAVGVAGVLLAAVNPLGPKLLLFPLQVTEQPEIFRSILEWRSPDFGRPGGLITLLAIAGCLGVLVRMQTPWRHAIPVLAFLVAGLFAQRNLPVAAVVFAPALGAALRRPQHDREEPAPPGFHWAAAAALAAVAVVAIVTTLGREPLRVVRYPAAAVAALEEQGIIDGDQRMVHEDKVGAYLILERGRDANIFVDDRAGLYEPEVIRDLLDLQKGERVLEILDDQRAEAVLWERDSPVHAAVAADRGWRRVYRDDHWVAFVRRAGR